MAIYMGNKYNAKMNKKLKQMTEQKKEFEAEWRSVLELAVWIGLLTGAL